MRLWKEESVLAGKIVIADTFFPRLRGLLGARGLGAGRGLLLTPCSAVHTFFMRFSLDLFFLDAQGRVVKMASNVPPWRMVAGGGQTRSVLELESGWLPADAVRVGDTLSLGEYRPGKGEHKPWP